QRRSVQLRLQRRLSEADLRPVEERLHLSLHPVGDLPHPPTLVGGELPHAPQHSGELPLLPQVAHAQRLEARRVGDPTDLLASLRRQRFQSVLHRLPPFKRRRAAPGGSPRVRSGPRGPFAGCECQAAAILAIAAKPSGSATAMSASTLRSSATSALDSPAISRL